MKTVYSDAHRLHAPELELAGNRFVPAYEQPVRADSVLDRVASSRLGSVEPPHDFGRAPIEAVHARDFVDFLASAWRDWSAAGEHGDAVASSGRMHDMGQRLPRSIVGRVAHYSFDATPITAGTWTAVYAAAQVALTAGSYLARGDRSAFGLCRPPGHHASRDYCGGYCYLNNAAIAAQALRERFGRVAILDTDMHHGQGVQEIFYGRDDVLYVSIHGDPTNFYPVVAGYEDERGAGEGDGYNVNLPMPHGAGEEVFFEQLDAALRVLDRFQPDALVLALGFDIYKDDPQSMVAVTTEGFGRLGGAIGGLRLPTLIVQEGGYHIDSLEANARSFFGGFASAR